MIIFTHPIVYSIMYNSKALNDVKRTFAIRFRYLLMNAVALLILRSKDNTTALDSGIVHYVLFIAQCHFS